MSGDELLSQDEIDALLHGVDGSEVEVEADDLPTNEPQPYDFSSQDHIVRGRLPALEMINERFARHFRISLFNMLKRSPELRFKNLRTLKLSDYRRGLLIPTSLNLVKIKPLQGMALFVLEPKLVSTLVDNYFGGGGRFPAKIEGRDFTPTEMRVIEMVLEIAFADLKNAWAPILDTEFAHMSSEVNPHFANIVGPSDFVVVSTFSIELEGGSGEFHVTIPYMMIEPIRNQLRSDTQIDHAQADERWQRALHEEIKSVELELECTFAEAQISLRELAKLRVGDVIPVEVPELLTLRTYGIPLFDGKFGSSKGKNSIKIVRRLKRLPNAAQQRC